MLLAGSQEARTRLLLLGLPHTLGGQPLLAALRAQLVARI